MDAEHVRTFVDITGADEAEARHTLEAFQWDLTAAINHYLEHGAPIPRHLESPIVGQQGNDSSQNAYGSPTFATRLPNSVNSTPRSQGLDMNSFAPLVDEESGPIRGLLPRVSHPPDVQDVPISWGDEEVPSFSSLAPKVEELPADADVEGPGSSSTPYYEEKDEDEGLASGRLASRTFARRNTSPLTEGDGVPMDSDRVEGGDHPDFAMGYSRVAAGDDEMLRTAIAKSRAEAQPSETRRSHNAFAVENDGRFGEEEDDDVARAMALSIETAEVERARREGTGRDNVVAVAVAAAGSDDMDGDFDESKENMPQAGSRLPGSNVEHFGWRAPQGTPLNLGEEEEDEDEVSEPLVRRRRPIARRGVASGRDVWPMPQQVDDGQRQNQSGTEGAGRPGDYSHWRGVQDAGGDYGQGDELAGVSAEEQEEAKMIEAAMFGVPYVPRNGAMQNPAVSTNYVMPPGLADQYGLGNQGLGFGGYGGFGNDDDEEEGEGFVQRRAPEPPSEEMIQQRLLREQQDDEYMASLTADREKEEKAEMEKEAAKREAQAEEDRKREEALSAQKAAEELERKLKEKQDALPEEPPSDDSGAITLQVRMPDGTRRSRRFHKSNTLQSLFDFVDVGGGVTPGSYRLVRTYPRRTFSEQSGEEALSFERLGLSSSKQETLLLENI